MQKKEDLKLFISLMLWTLVPSVYLLIRMQIVSLNNVSIDILGQMEWFDLIDEVLVTMLITPLYFLLKKEKSTKEKNSQAFILAFCLYFIFTVVIAFYIGHIASYMKAEYAVQYLLLQSISMLIGFIGTFCLLLFTLNNDHRIITVLIPVKFLILAMFDFVMIGKWQDAGAAYSEIAANILIATVSLILAVRRKYLSFNILNVFHGSGLWLKEWLKIGSFSGFQIFLDNIVYALMIAKMVNEVAESGNYWVANNFIWGWLLVPVTCFSEIIRKNNLKRLTFANTWKYTLGIILFWIISMPGWRWFIGNMMAVDADAIMNIVFPVMPYYLVYPISQCLQSWFISAGKTYYTAVISIVVNIGYYGIVFMLFRSGIFNMDMSFIIGMFGWGMVVNCICCVILYMIEQRKGMIR